MIIYDCEIVKAIQGKNEERLQGIEYCEGWHDHAGMGISVICVYDYATGRYRVFCADNFPEFQELVNSTNIVVGFNSIGFDNKLCAANGLNVPAEKTYDLLAEIWAGSGLTKTFKFGTHTGFGLEACCQANFGLKKTGNGATAPVDWQRGKIGKVIDYCLNDISLTKILLDQVIEKGFIIDPRYPDVRQIKVASPIGKKIFTAESVAADFDKHDRLNIVFTKRDNSERKMFCTNKLSEIPKEHHPNSDNPDKPTPSHLFKVFDLQAQGWRSFTVANLISIEPA